MSLDPELLELMPHTISLMAPTGKNAQGQPTYVGGVPVSYQCRIVGMLMALRKKEVSEKTQLFDIYAHMGADPVTADYQLTIPADPAFDGQNPLIFTVTRETDEEGFHHTKLSCGFMYHRQGGS